MSDLDIIPGSEPERIKAEQWKHVSELWLEGRFDAYLVNRRIVEAQYEGDLLAIRTEADTEHRDLLSGGIPINLRWHNRQQQPATPFNESAASETPSRFNHPSAMAISELSLNLTIVAEESDNWQRFQYAGEDKGVIIDRMDNQITHHVGILDNELARLQAEVKQLREALTFAQSKLSEIDKSGMFSPSDFFTLTDILDVFNQSSLNQK